MNHNIVKIDWIENLMNNYSSLRMLLHITAYLQRFIHCFSNKKQLVNEKRTVEERALALVLTVKEKQEAVNFWIKYLQQAYFSEEIETFKKNKCIFKGSKLLNLNPFLDEDGILRVGGRLRNADIPYDQKHPPILPNRTHFIQLLLQQAHEATLHGGQRMMLSYIRGKYWIINARNMVRFFVKKCVKCTIHNPSMAQQLMGDLPLARVTKSHVFSHVGIDFTGPFNMKTSSLPDAPIVKTYICLFICFATKAIHLEVVEDLTTNGFLASFRRFVSRRGLCSNIYCDNGRNFVGASNELPRQLQNSITKQSKDIVQALLKDGIAFHFTPPRTPNFGGLYERAIRSMKHHMKRQMGNAQLTYVELETLISQIEACLNSRPLCAMSEDAESLDILSPAHFLIGRALNVPPEPSPISKRGWKLSKWKQVQYMYHRFWKLWSNEYLNDLEVRNKWKNLNHNIDVGDLVILREQNAPPCKWNRGKVIKVYPGRDNLVRAVDVKTESSEFRRGVNQLCKLPVEH